MKAEQRKELHTNALADRMGKLVEGIKHPPSTTSVVTWVIAGLAVVTVIAWFALSRPSETNAGLWVKLDADTFNKPDDYFAESNQDQVVRDLSDIARNHRRTVPGRTASFQEARYQLAMGLKGVATPFRSSATNSLMQARQRFLELAKECSDNPVLLQEAYLGAAKAEEALIGVPDENDKKNVLGSVEKAKEYYGKASAVNKDSYLGHEAARHFEQLDKNAEEVVKFYTDLNKRSSLPAGPRDGMPGMPGLPPGLMPKLPGHP